MTANPKSKTRNQKSIVLGVTGSIAAYKSAELASLLVKQNHNVFVVMTNDATEFITPLTLQTLSKNPVLTKKRIGDPVISSSRITPICF